MEFTFFKIISIGLLLLVSYDAFTQKDIQGKAYYESKMNMDMSTIGRPDMSEERRQEMTNRMRSALEKTYVLTFNQVESIYKEEVNESTQNTGYRRGGRFRAMLSSFAPGIQYKNVKEALFLQDQEFFGKQFLIKDELSKLEWKMTGETKQVGKYLCFKATALKTVSDIDFTSFRRPRDTDEDEKKEDGKPKQIEVVAWYTMQIPVSQGPEEYWGLPGLILEIHAGKTTILCTKIIINGDEKEEIIIPSKGKKVSKAQYDKIVRRKMQEMQANFRNRSGDRGGNRR